MEFRNHARIALLVAASFVCTRGTAFAQEFPPPPPPPVAAPPATLQAPPPPPPGYMPFYPAQPLQLQPPALRPPVVEQRPMTGLIVGGAVTLGVPWIISAFTGGIIELGSAVCNDLSNSSHKCNTGAWALFIPVAGPFVLMAQTEQDNLKALLAFDGVVQLAGLTMVIVGAVVRRPVELRAAGVTVAPYMAGAGSAGLMLRGSF